MIIKVSDDNLSVTWFVICILCTVTFKQYLQADGPDVKPARGHLVVVSSNLVNWLFVKERTREDGFVHASKETKWHLSFEVLMILLHKSFYLALPLKSAV